MEVIVRYWDYKDSYCYPLMRLWASPFFSWGTRWDYSAMQNGPHCLIQNCFCIPLWRRILRQELRSQYQNDELILTLIIYLLVYRRKLWYTASMGVITLLRNTTEETIKWHHIMGHKLWNHACKSNINIPTYRAHHRFLFFLTKALSQWTQSNEIKYTLRAYCCNKVKLCKLIFCNNGLEKKISLET